MHVSLHLWCTGHSFNAIVVLCFHPQPAAQPAAAVCCTTCCTCPTPIGCHQVVLLPYLAGCSTFNAKGLGPLGRFAILPCTHTEKVQSAALRIRSTYRMQPARAKMLQNAACAHANMSQNAHTLKIRECSPPRTLSQYRMQPCAHTQTI